MISVIIPTYNTGQFVLEAVDSALQLGPPVGEVIVVDDGSTDATERVLEPVRDRIVYIRQQNRGVSAARNRGFAEARGDWLLFLDADDKLLPHDLQARMRCGSHAAILHSGWYLVSENGALLEEVRPFEQFSRLDLAAWLLWKPVLPGAMMFSRDWVRRVGGFDETLHHAEDVDLVLRIAAAGGTTHWWGQPTLHYRQRDASASRNTARQSTSMVRVLDKIFENPNVPAHVQRQEGPIRYYTYLWHSWALLADGEHDLARSLLREAKRCMPWPDAFLLLDWARRSDAIDAMLEVLDPPLAPDSILSGTYAGLPPMQQAELAHFYFIVHRPDAHGLAQHLAPAGKLAVHLSACIWDFNSRSLLLVLRYAFQRHAPEIVARVLTSAWHRMFPQRPAERMG